MVPQEVLEHIAFFAATEGFLGPPSGLVPLLSLNRATHAALSCRHNPHLYAQIFAAKFDVDAAARRLGSGKLSAAALTEELQRRSNVLKRIRGRQDAKAPASDKHLRWILWTAFLMALESDGKNERQLLEYAQVNEWLKEYLFDPKGASTVVSSIGVSDVWPRNSDELSLALWLFWYMLQPDDYLKNDSLFRHTSGILKVIALGAHKYPCCYPEWIEFVPRSCRHAPTVVKHFSSEISLVAPAPAAPAILAYLTLVNKLGVSWVDPAPKPLLTPMNVDRRTVRKSAERDCDWARLCTLADPKLLLKPRLAGAFTPGGLEGVWEGIFTYTEFTSYAALLSGAPPSVLQKSLVAQHRQTIKIREWHFIEPTVDPYAPREHTRPLAPGNPTRGYIPDGVEAYEHSDRLELLIPGSPKPCVYLPWSTVKKMNAADRVVDVFLTGEGHSAWGQFNLLGRVRPSDGYISLSKEYLQTDGDRGKWLYRAYMVGNANGNLTGRWRDTLSPPHMPGYEGTWVASRRR